MSNYISILKSEQANVLGAFWSLLRQAEQNARDTNNVLDKRDVEACYRLWNRCTGDQFKAHWEI